MEAYNRPLTPPDHELKNKVPDIDGLQKKQEQTFPPVTVGASNPFQQDKNSEPPVGYRVGTAFPFEKSHTEASPTNLASNLETAPKLSQLSEKTTEPAIPARQHAPLAQEPVRHKAVEQSTPLGQASTRETHPSGSNSQNYGSQRNETTQRIEKEVLDVLKWKSPMRSACMLVMIVGSILLTRSYSLLQIGAMALSLAIGINLVYVQFMVQGQRVLSQERATHPYQDMINNDKRSINRESVRHYTNVFIDLSETTIRALTRIVFIDNTKTSLKWLGISFLVWKVSAHLSVTTLVLLLTLSAFTFPRLYISNKDVVDAHLQRGQHYIQTSLNKAQEVAKDSIQDTYTKARSMAAQAGTTGTDAKNVLRNASVVEKQD